MKVSLKTISQLWCIFLCGQVICGELNLQRDEDVKEFLIPSDADMNLDLESYTEGGRDDDNMGVDETGGNYTISLLSKRK